MKKTLLSLALAGLAASAFANVSVYKSENADLYVGGYARYFFLNGDNKADLEKNERSLQRVRYRVYFGGDFHVADSTKFGFYLRLQNNPINDDKTNTYKRANKNAAWSLSAKEESKSAGVQYLYFDRAYVYAANDQFGKLELGRTTTVRDDFVGSDLEILDFDTAVSLNLVSGAQKVIKYYSPAIDKFSFAYSYGTSEYDRKGGFVKSGVRKNQNAFQGVYSFETGTTVLAGLVLENQYLNRAKTNELQGYEVAVAQSYNQGNGVVAVAYDYSTNKSLNTTTHQSEGKAAHHSWVVKTNYKLNQYFQPYAGLTYQELKDTESKTKVYGAYLGVNSDVYKLESLKVRLFAETSYLKAKEKAYAAGSTKEKTKDLAFATGLKVFF